MMNQLHLNVSAQEFQPVIISRATRKLPGSLQYNQLRGPYADRRYRVDNYNSNPRARANFFEWEDLAALGGPRMPYGERRYRVDNYSNFHPRARSQLFEWEEPAALECELRVRAKIAEAFRKDRLYKRYVGKPKETDSSKKRLKSQGRGFKSKQIKINVVYQNLIEKFEKTDYLKPEVERTHQTSRVHAKTWDGLNLIERALDEVLVDESIEICEIGFHKSMKNKYQQKGILVYLKVGSQAQVERLFDIYNSFGRHLKDHAIAVSKEERVKINEGIDSEIPPTDASSDEPASPQNTMIVSQSNEIGSIPKKMIMQNREVSLPL